MAGDRSRPRRYLAPSTVESVRLDPDLKQTPARRRSSDLGLAMMPAIADFPQCRSSKFPGDRLGGCGLMLGGAGLLDCLAEGFSSGAV